jgi:hypothetical protein
VFLFARWIDDLAADRLVLLSRTAADSAKTRSRWPSLLPVGSLIITVMLVGMGSRLMVSIGVIRG